MATVASLRQAIADGETTAAEVCETYLDRIESVDTHLNAFTVVFHDLARGQAEEVDRMRDAWRDRPLLGIPVTIKDVICTKDGPTTGASRILAGYQSPYDATVVERLRAAGAVVVGKTNCDEFAMGSSTEYSAHGPTRNPWSTDRIPGGSSGGRRSRGCRQASTGLDRLGHGRLHSATGGILWRGRAQANLWPRLPLRSPGVCIVA